METADIDDYFSSLTEIEINISRALGEIAEMQGEEKRQFSRNIEDSLNEARHFLTSIDLELCDLPESLKPEYEGKKNHHQQVVTQYEDQLKATTRGINGQKEGPLTDKDIANKALDLQNQQKNSLDNSINMVNQIQDVGNSTLEEINRQEGKIGEAMDNLEMMDDELERAKHIMKQMVYRATGDCCVRILAVIVVIVLVGLIVIEIVKPGAIKKTSDGWFENNSTSGSIS